LSGALSQATGAEAEGFNPSIPPQLYPKSRPSGPLGFVRRGLQQSGLARGCVNTWANSSPPSADCLEATGSLTATDDDAPSDSPRSTFNGQEELQEEEEAIADLAPVA
jgi:hypothetical protein